MKRWSIILIILALLAGGAAAAVYFSNKNEGKSKTSSQESKKTDPSEGGKYLVIKEWNVRFRLPEEYKSDIYYSVIDDRKIRYGSKKFSALYENCKAENTGLGGLYRKKQGDSIRSDEEFLPQTFKTINDYNYHFLPNSTSCESSIPSSGELALEESKLDQSIKMLEAY